MFLPTDSVKEPKNLIFAKMLKLMHNRCAGDKKHYDQKAINLTIL